MSFWKIVLFILGGSCSVFLHGLSTFGRKNIAVVYEIT
jgi:hypothetical protein